MTFKDRDFLKLLDFTPEEIEYLIDFAASLKAKINISARSYGDLNVQIIMEYLGGGGHRTMAAAQLTGVNMEEAKSKLCEAIDAKYPRTDGEEPTPIS